MFVCEAHNDYNGEFVDMSNKYTDNEQLCNWLLSFYMDGYEVNADDSSSRHTLSLYE